jgi:hypothetical protein
MEQLVSLGISWVWMGLEGQSSQYSKLRHTDTHALVAELQSHGIRVLGSSIIGLESHTPQNIDQAIDHAVGHQTEFHQFMLYTPIPGTPLYAQLEADGVLLEPGEIDQADIHGQLRFNYRHPHIPAGDETEMLQRAFERDFQTNGPSVLRVIRTIMMGWRRYRDHPDARIRTRFDWEMKGCATTMAGALWAARKWFRGNELVVRKMDEVLQEIYREFGLKSRIVAPLVGRYLMTKLRKEDQRLRSGWTCEPPTYYDLNERAAALSRLEGRDAQPLRSVCAGQPAAVC